MLFFPFRYKAPLAFPQMFSLYFYSYTILSDSLSLFFSFKGVALANIVSHVTDNEMNNRDSVPGRCTQFLLATDFSWTPEAITSMRPEITS
jgi:hypothetical protein